MTSKRGNKKKYTPRRDKPRSNQARELIEIVPEDSENDEQIYAYNNREFMGNSPIEDDMLLEPPTAGMLIEDLQTEPLDSKMNDYWCALLRNLFLLNIVFTIYPTAHPETEIDEDMRDMIIRVILAEKQVAIPSSNWDEYEIGMNKLLFGIKCKQTADLLESNEARATEPPTGDSSETDSFPEGLEDTRNRTPDEHRWADEWISSFDSNYLRYIPPGMQLQDVNAVPVRCVYVWNSDKFLYRKQCLHSMIYALRPNASMEEVLDRNMRKVVATVLKTESIKFQIAQTWRDYLDSVDKFISYHRQKFLEAECREIDKCSKEAAKGNAPVFQLRKLTDHPIEAEFAESNEGFEVELDEESSEDSVSMELYVSDDELVHSEMNAYTASRARALPNLRPNFGRRIKLNTVIAKPARPCKNWHQHLTLDDRSHYLQHILQKIFPRLKPESILNMEAVVVYTSARAAECNTYRVSNSMCEYREKCEVTKMILFDWCEKYRNLSVVIQTRDSGDPEEMQGPQPMYQNAFHFELTRLHLQFILHADFCRDEGTLDYTCNFSYCQPMKNVLRQMRNCPVGFECMAPHCSSSRQLIAHWRACMSPSCPICVPLIFQERL